MQELFTIVIAIGIIALVIWVIKGLTRNTTNTPTWEGIIISAILGMLPFYLFLCFFGIMGENGIIICRMNQEVMLKI